MTIIEFRVHLDFHAQPINLFFLLETNAEGERDFANIVNGIEQIVLGEENLSAEIFYLNRAGKKLDSASIQSDYPYIFDLKKIEDATRSGPR